MNKSRLLGAVCTCLISSISLSAHAVAVSGQGTWETTLQGRDLDGNAATFEAYYDTTLNITWLSDAHAAVGSVYDTWVPGTGRMSWANANDWAAGLDVNGVTGWRLPTNTPVNGTSYSLSWSTDATTDRGYAPTTTDGKDGGWRESSGTPVSELGHMNYVTLGNLGYCDPAHPWVGSSCTIQSGFDGLSNTGPFINLTSAAYWSGSELDSSLAWRFNFGFGLQRDILKSIEYDGWAVRSGDVSAVPLPASVWLFGSALLGLVAAKRKKA
jgi:hypothetical protein